jgi:hypothetical protein
MRITGGVVFVKSKDDMNENKTEAWTLAGHMQETV